VLTWLSFCLPLSARDDKDIFKEGLRKRLSFIFNDDALRGMNLGAVVYSLSRQEDLFKLNAETGLSPASTVKMLTAFVALKRLGPDFRFETDLYRDGQIRGSTLEGNLYLVGGGDPHLVSERMYLLVNQLKRTGISRVTGQIFVDDSAFDEIRVDEARIPTKTDRAYNAPVSALSFNYNTTTVFYQPGDKEGEKPTVYIEPDTGYVKLTNKSKTTRRTSRNRMIASRHTDKEGDLVVMQGSIPRGYPEQRSFFNITKPSIYAGKALQYFMAKEGIQVVKPLIQKKEKPKTAQKLLTFKSLPLRDIVTLMNKYSNNFIADTLVKTMGMKFKGAPGTMAKGLEVINEEATRIGINYGPYKVVSGSGLTRKNSVSAKQFVELLNAAYLDFEVLPEMLASLPIAGKDGTLEKRMKQTAAFGQLRAKTGTIDGVSALTGVVQSKGGEMLAFAVLMNDPQKRSGRNMKRWENYFGQALASFNRKTELDEQPEPIHDVMGGGGSSHGTR